MAAFTFGGYMNITIREVTEEDAEALSAIYRPYVEETGITFSTYRPMRKNSDAAYSTRRKSILTLPPAMKAGSSAMPTPGLS